VFGDGSQHQQLLEIAGPTVEFHTDRMTTASDKAVNEALNHAKGFIFTATDEDFGIVQAEALAAGAPVIALGRGGALDIVEDGVSGVFYNKQSVDSVVEAIKKAETKTFLPATLRRKATRFDKGLFISKIRKIVSDHTDK
ncbi:MAG: glycosyltransferase, partial [Candidatus Microsaccharimonas sp.]